jgi:hypothetical protein
VASLLQSADFWTLWDSASTDERQILINNLIESINIYPDQVTVQVVGAPAIKMTPDENGLVGGKTVVSESRLPQSPTAGLPRGLTERCASTHNHLFALKF